MKYKVRAFFETISNIILILLFIAMFVLAFFHLGFIIYGLFKGI